MMAEIENDLRTNAAVFLGDGPDAPYVAAAYYLSERFVSKPFADQYFVTEEVGQTKTMTARTGAMLVTIGETIFQLRKSPCLGEFCYRMGTRDPYSAFYEALAARMFLESGFDVTAIQESGIRGEDFDFRAERNGQTVCVEVTTLRRTESLSENTVYNALRQKMEQLPRNKPGVIFCVTPESWFSRGDAPAQLVRQARRLYGVSKRVNAVVYLSEQNDDLTIAGEAYGTLQYRMIPAPNDKARHPFDALNFLNNETGEDISKSAVLASMPDHASIQRAYRDRPFFNWVNERVGIASA